MGAENSAGEMIINFAMDGAKCSIRLAGKAAMEVMSFITAMVKKLIENSHATGEQSLKTMLKSQQGMSLFLIPRKPEGNVKEFEYDAKEYGFRYHIINDPNVDEKLMCVVVENSNAPLVNRIVQNLGGEKVDAELTSDEAEQVRKTEKQNNRKRNSEGEKTPNRDPDQEKTAEKTKKEGETKKEDTQKENPQKGSPDQSAGGRTQPSPSSEQKNTRRESQSSSKSNNAPTFGKTPTDKRDPITKQVDRAKKEAEKNTAQKDRSDRTVTPQKTSVYKGGR